MKPKKAYLAWVDFESTSDKLDFGVQEPSSESQNQQESKPEQSQSQEAQPDPSREEETGEEEKSSEPLPQEVNALYERLLQEMESKSEPLGQEMKVAGPDQTAETTDQVMAMEGNIDSFSPGQKSTFRPRLIAFFILSFIPFGSFLLSQNRNARAEAFFSPQHHPFEQHDLQGRTARNPRFAPRIDASLILV